MSNAWISLDSLKAALKVTGTNDDDILQRSIYEAQSALESATGHVFEATTNTRYYRADDLLRLDVPGGTGTVLLLRDDLQALGGLTNGDGTTIASTDCWLEPRNSKPYQYLRLKSGVSWNFAMDGEIVVSGTWGYTTSAPDDLVQATKQLAGYFYKLKTSGAVDVIGSAETGTVLAARGMPAGVTRILLDGGYIKKLGLI